jgi:fumarate reductase flavoprotein subunit
MNEGPDLVVAGAGGGIVAALRAAQLGLDVLVVERSEHFSRGNNTAMSTAMVPGAGSRWQADAGIDDSADIFVGDILRKTGCLADERLARALAEVSARLLTWMADDLELPMSLVTDFPYPGHSRLRCHTVPGRSGRNMLDGLISAMRAQERIMTLVPARVSGVSTGSDGVESVTVTDPSGREETIPTRAVLLATNGFGAAPDLVAQHIPEIAGAVYHGSAESTGDALRIGTALGADTAYLDGYQGHAALAMPAATLAGWATVMHGGFLVDGQGKRFGDETVGYSEYAQQVLAHAGGRAVLVLDQRIHDACLAFDDFRDTVESGALRWADTPHELAAGIGVNAEGLAATIDRTAGLADGGVDELGRTHWEAPLRPPYVGIQVSPALFHTQGGLRVDGDARVLRPDGSPIRGLYASGGAAMGISGHGASGYLAGNGLLPALGLAFLAAEHVAADRRATP